MSKIKNDKKNRINEEITAREVRLLDVEGEQLGVVSINKALELAREAGVDLVEISPMAVPPVCRLMDYGKFTFDKNKQQQKQKPKPMKEIQFRPGTEEGDYQVKLRNLLRFLEEGHKCKITLRFRGREMAHQEIGRDLLKRVEFDLGENGSIDQMPRMEGRQMVMVVSPKKK